MNALRVAHHIVRSEPAARVLVINIELCTLHMQDTPELEKISTALLFGDGCTAALVSSDEAGIALMDFRAVTIPGTQSLLTWDIGDQGFEMHLSGEIPSQITRALSPEVSRNDEGIFRGSRPEGIDLWAVHAGGRTVLDAVEHGLSLDGEALRWSRGMLREFGNMSAMPACSMWKTAWSISACSSGAVFWRGSAKAGMRSSVISANANRICETVSEEPSPCLSGRSRSRTRFDLGRLLEECSISTNTAAAGGNASLMSLG